MPVTPSSPPVSAWYLGDAQYASAGGDSSYSLQRRPAPATDCSAHDSQVPCLGGYHGRSTCFTVPPPLGAGRCASLPTRRAGTLPCQVFVTASSARFYLLPYCTVLYCASHLTMRRLFLYSYSPARTCGGRTVRPSGSISAGYKPASAVNSVAWLGKDRQSVELGVLNPKVKRLAGRHPIIRGLGHAGRHLILLY